MKPSLFLAAAAAALIALSSCASPVASPSTETGAPILQRTTSVRVEVSADGPSRGALEPQVTAVRVDVLTDQGEILGTGTLVRKTGYWSGDIAVTRADAALVQATAKDSDGSPRFFGRAATTILASGSSVTVTVAPLRGSIVYDGNGNTSGTAPIDSATYAAGAAVSVSGPGTLAKTGFTFAGWTTDNAGVGTSYPGDGTGTLTMGTSRVLVHAVWVPEVFTFTSSGNSISITGNTGVEPSGRIVFPCGVTSFLATDPMNLWDANGFQMANTTLTSAVLPPTVTDLGIGLFSYCIGLEEVTLPPNLTAIGDDTFKECRSLKAVSIPEGVTEMGSCAFLDCESLKEIHLPDSLTSLGYDAMTSCWSLTSLSIPSGIRTIAGGTFNDCRGLESVSLPDGITSIDEFAFYSCTNLKTLTLPTSLVSLGQFSLGKTTLTDLYLFSSVPPTVGGSPPTLFDDLSPAVPTIHVPAASLDAYKAAAGWSDYADKIVGM